MIQRERVPGFERMLWRVSRGNVFLRQAELEEPIEDPATVSAAPSPAERCTLELQEEGSLELV